MGNASACCARRKQSQREARAEEANHAIRAADAACADQRLRRRTDEQGRHISRTGKWSFSVIEVHRDPTSAEDPEKDRRVRLELFAGPIEKVKGANWKWLQGPHFMKFVSYSVYEEYNCFLYKTLGNIREYISVKRMALGRDREAVIARFLPDIFAHIKYLGFLGLHHTALSWDAIEIGLDGRAKLGSLEYLVERRLAVKHDMADVRHLPPESLKRFGPNEANRDVSKMEIWIIGSLLLEILLHKHISGPAFVLGRTRPARRVALSSIRENVPRLPLFLDASSLSPQMQDLLKGMLCIDVLGRINIDQALFLCTSGSTARIKGVNHRQDKEDPLKARWSGSERTCTTSESRRFDDAERPAGFDRREESLEDKYLKRVETVGEHEKANDAESSGMKTSEKCLNCEQAAQKVIVEQKEEDETTHDKNELNVQEVDNSSDLYYQVEETNQSSDDDNDDVATPIVTEPDEGGDSTVTLAMRQHAVIEPSIKDSKVQDMVTDPGLGHGSAKVLISIKFLSGNKITCNQITSSPLHIEGIRCDDVTVDETWTSTLIQAPNTRNESTSGCTSSPCSSQTTAGGNNVTATAELQNIETAASDVTPDSVSTATVNNSSKPSESTNAADVTDQPAGSPVKAVSSLPSSLNVSSGAKQSGSRLKQHQAPNPRHTRLTKK